MKRDDEKVFQYNHREATNGDGEMYGGRLITDEPPCMFCRNATSKNLASSITKCAVRLRTLQEYISGGTFM